MPDTLTQWLGTAIKPGRTGPRRSCSGTAPATGKCSAAYGSSPTLPNGFGTRPALSFCWTTRHSVAVETGRDSRQPRDASPTADSTRLVGRSPRSSSTSRRTRWCRQVRCPDRSVLTSAGEATSPPGQRTYKSSATSRQAGSTTDSGPWRTARRSILLMERGLAVDRRVRSVARQCAYQ